MLRLCVIGRLGTMVPLIREWQVHICNRLTDCRVYWMSWLSTVFYVRSGTPLQYKYFCVKVCSKIYYNQFSIICITWVILWLRCCKLENEISKKAKNLEKWPTMIILRLKNVIFERFWPLSKFHFPACSTLPITRRLWGSLKALIMYAIGNAP